jgi:hypothetical protein
MRRWGIVITAFYVAILLLLLFPAGALLITEIPLTGQKALDAYRKILNVHEWWWMTWLYAGILVGGQALLLFLSVDTSWRRARPRQHLAITTALAAFLMAILMFAATWSLALGIFGQNVVFELPHSPFQESERTFVVRTAAWCAGLWALWTVIFHSYQRGTVEPVTRIVSWLLRGSVLELLIAVPAHVIVRHRNECSAPAVTSWGIVTGLAIMLLCFGPSVLALYRKKLDAYSRKDGRAVSEGT